MTDKKISLKSIKIRQLGDSTVGKTAIFNSFFNNGSDILETRYNLKNINKK